MRYTRSLKALSLPLAISAVLLQGGHAAAQSECGAAMPDFQAALKANTAEAMAAYLDEHAPCFEVPAKARLEALGGRPEQAAAETEPAAPAATAAAAQPAAPAPDAAPEPTSELAGLAEARENGAVCEQGLSLLAKNMYVHPNAPAVATGTPLSWAEAYGRFERDHLPACRAIGAFVEANPDVPAIAEIRAALDAEESYGSWADHFDGRLGIVTQGSRIPNYCPNLHLIQFNCVTASERIVASSALLRDNIERIGAIGTE